MKNESRLLELIGKMEPVEFIGLARLLGVQVVKKENDEVAPREFSDVLNDVMAKYSMLGRTKKREVLRLVEKSVSKKR